MVRGALRRTAVLSHSWKRNTWRSSGKGRCTMNILMPQLGETVSEGTIITWLKSEGDTVLADEILLELETDKAATEVPAPIADRKSTRLNSSHSQISYAVFCLTKKKR